MTVYNGMYRCPGGQKKPNHVIMTPRGLFGECRECPRWFRLYRNGKLVMHKRKTARRDR